MLLVKEKHIQFEIEHDTKLLVVTFLEKDETQVFNEVSHPNRISYASDNDNAIMTKLGNHSITNVPGVVAVCKRSGIRISFQ